MRGILFCQCFWRPLRRIGAEGMTAIGPKKGPNGSATCSRIAAWQCASHRRYRR